MARVLKDLLLWEHRLTTATHVIRAEEGYGFADSQYVPASSEIIDGGVAYPPEILDSSETRWISESQYSESPGGAYSVSEWTSHPLLHLAVNDKDTIKNYGRILTVLSQGRPTSPGLESMWWPQSLPVGHGRAIALGLGADSLYPPNRTTIGHWTAIKI